MPKRPDPTPEAALLQGCSQTPASGHNRLPGQQSTEWGVRTCPECMRLFEAKVFNQLFCSSAHNTDWNNRWTKRGRVFAQIGIVAYLTRHGTRGTPEKREAGRKAANERHVLAQRWRDEDAKAGRMEVTAFAVLRDKLGFDPL